jgi:hypothetical protein
VVAVVVQMALHRQALAALASLSFVTQQINYHQLQQLVHHK